MYYNSLLSGFVIPSFSSSTAAQRSSCLAMQKSLSFVTGVEQIAKDHDIFLLDMWGVMHDGTAPYEGVLDCVQELKRAGKELVILSNSSQRKENSERMLIQLGFDPNDFHQIITSGDIAHRMLSLDQTLECQVWPILSEIREKRVFVLGSGSQDKEYCESSGWTLATVDEANLIIARGTFTICDGTNSIQKKEDESEYYRILDESLRKAASRKLPMLITNPDKVRPDTELPPMPGAIGDAYASLLEEHEADSLIKRIGKPFPEVYELALKDRDPNKACMVGDALETDVTGGSAVGVTTVWVTQDGIHGPFIDSSYSIEEGVAVVLEQFNAKKGTYSKDGKLRPSVVLPHFRWSL